MRKPPLERALAQAYGAPPTVEIVPLQGDASTRRYYRARVDTSATSGGPESLIVMQLPEDALRSDEGGAQPEVERLPFLEVAELLSARGVRVPEVYAEDLANGILLLEDLGDTTLHQALHRTPRQRWGELYERATDLLAKMHEACAELPATSIVARRRFDRALLDWELAHFRQWGLEALVGALTVEERHVLHDAFAQIAGAIEALPVGFVHRDYQSKNLMVDQQGELAVLDFQDAMVGPRVYDLVALLCDSYVDLPEDLQSSLIARYAALRRIDPETLLDEFWWVALHRKLKDAGRFVFIDRVRRNPSFLRWFPQSLVYVGRAMQKRPELRALDTTLRRRIPGYPDAAAPPSSSVE